jgi:hypothetical protein
MELSLVAQADTSARGCYAAVPPYAGIGAQPVIYALLECNIQPALAEAGASGGLTAAQQALIVAASVMILLWFIAVVIVFRYRRRSTSLAEHRKIVLGQDKLSFGTPEPLRKNLNDMFSGGEIDMDGRMTLYGAELNTARSDVRETEFGQNAEGVGASLPTYGNVRANPLFLNQGGTEDGSGMVDIYDGNGDGAESIGDLSDFEEADFEAFADSLLDDFEGELDSFLFSSAGQTARGSNDLYAATQRASLNLDSGDDLSDFELDLTDAAVRAAISPPDAGYDNLGAVVATAQYEDPLARWQTRSDGSSESRLNQGRKVSFAPTTGLGASLAAIPRSPSREGLVTQLNGFFDRANANRRVGKHNVVSDADDHLDKTELRFRLDLKGMAKVMKEHNILDRFDSDGNGKLNREELLAAMDVDGDGKISRTEFVRAILQAPESNMGGYASLGSSPYSPGR